MKHRNTQPPSAGLPVVIGLAVGIVVLAVYYAVVHVPKSRQLDELERVNTELSARYEQVTQQAAGRDSALLSLNRLCDLRDDRLNQLPIVPDRHRIGFRLEELARSAELEEISASWGSPTPLDSRTQNPLSLRTRGTYDAALRFVETLKLNDQEVFLTKMSFASPGEDHGGRRTRREPVMQMQWTLGVFSATPQQREGGELCQLAQDDSAPTTP